MNAIFLGPPGAGKGTHASRAAASLGVPYIGTGDMLRGAIAGGTRVGLEAKAYIDAGDLVPDGIVIGIARERLGMPDCAGGFILDGFPRTIEQAWALAGFGRIDRVISVELDDEALIERIAGRRVCGGCGGIHNVETLGGRDECPVCSTPLARRGDDEPDVVRHRLEVYHRETAPLRDYYMGLGVIKSVRSDRPVPEVSADILAALAE